MNSTGKKTLGVLTGIGIALAFGVVMFLLRNVIADMLLAFGVQRSTWSHILSVILPTELIVIGAAILLWRRQRAAVAIGLASRTVPASSKAASACALMSQAVTLKPLRAIRRATGAPSIPKPTKPTFFGRN